MSAIKPLKPLWPVLGVRPSSHRSANSELCSLAAEPDGPDAP